MVVRVIADELPRQWRGHVLWRVDVFEGAAQFIADWSDAPIIDRQFRVAGAQRHRQRIPHCRLIREHEIKQIATRIPDFTKPRQLVCIEIVISVSDVVAHVLHPCCNRASGDAVDLARGNQVDLVLGRACDRVRSCDRDRHCSHAGIACRRRQERAQSVPF